MSAQNPVMLSGSQAILYDYFESLPDNPQSIRRIEHYWPKLDQHSWAPHQTAHILFHVSQAFSRVPMNSPFYFKLQEYVVQNMAVLMDKALPAFSYAFPPHLCLLLKGCYRLDIQPSRHAMMQAEQNLIENIDLFDPKNIASFLHCCAGLRYYPARAADAILPQLAVCMNDITPADIAQLYWSAAVFEALEKRELPLSRNLHAMLGQALTHLTPEEFENTFSHPADRHSIRDAQLWFTESCTQPHLVTDNISSTRERTLSDIFAHVSGLKKAETHLPRLNKYTDFAFEQDGRRIHLELDGPRHFLTRYETGLPVWNGNTLFQSALLAKLYPDDILIRLPSHIMDQAAQDLQDDHMIGQQLAKGMAVAAKTAKRHPADPKVSAVGYNPKSGLHLKPLQ